MPVRHSFVFYLIMTVMMIPHGEFFLRYTLYLHDRGISSNFHLTSGILEKIWNELSFSSYYCMNHMYSTACSSAVVVPFLRIITSARFFRGTYYSGDEVDPYSFYI